MSLVGLRSSRRISAAVSLAASSMICETSAFFANVVTRECPASDPARGKFIPIFVPPINSSGSKVIPLMPPFSKVACIAVMAFVAGPSCKKGLKAKYASISGRRDSGTLPMNLHSAITQVLNTLEKAFATSRWVEKPCSTSGFVNSSSNTFDTFFSFNLMEDASLFSYSKKKNKLFFISALLGDDLRRLGCFGFQ